MQFVNAYINNNKQREVGAMKILGAKKILGTDINPGLVVVCKDCRTHFLIEENDLSGVKEVYHGHHSQYIACPNCKTDVYLAGTSLGGGIENIVPFQKSEYRFGDRKPIPIFSFADTDT